MKKIIIKKSKIEGKGVFANKNFKKGEVVIKWDISNKISKIDYEKLPEKEKRYIAHINGEYIVNLPPAKYVNHSCNANTKAINYCDVAIRDIKKGEEITGNYMEDTPEMEKWKCNCRDKKCKGFLK